ncbi:MAG: hypothetical protein RBR15_16985 [Sphaerochaeta sp.]|nr:hypothetical protein [Sphaerochaeta sp.]
MTVQRAFVKIISETRMVVASKGFEGKGSRFCTFCRANSLYCITLWSNLTAKNLFFAEISYDKKARAECENNT